MTQLILTHHYWAKAPDHGCYEDVAFLDFSKAFGRVSHLVLLKELCSRTLGFLDVFFDGVSINLGILSMVK